MKKYSVNWDMVCNIAFVIACVMAAILAMYCAGFEFSIENGIYKAIGWHATLGELASGIKHIDYRTHLNIFDIIRLWNV